MAKGIPWQNNMKDILVQQGLIKSLNGKEKKYQKMTNEEWEEMEMKVLIVPFACA